MKTNRANYTRLAFPNFLSILMPETYFVTKKCTRTFSRRKVILFRKKKRNNIYTLLAIRNQEDAERLLNPLSGIAFLEQWIDSPYSTWPTTMNVLHRLENSNIGPHDYKILHNEAAPKAAAAARTNMDNLFKRLKNVPETQQNSIVPAAFLLRYLVDSVEDYIEEAIECSAFISERKYNARERFVQAVESFLRALRAANRLITALSNVISRLSSSSSSSSATSSINILLKPREFIPLDGKTDAPDHNLWLQTTYNARYNSDVQLVHEDDEKTLVESIRRATCENTTIAHISANNLSRGFFYFFVRACARRAATYLATARMYHSLWKTCAQGDISSTIFLGTLWFAYMTSEIAVKVRNERIAYVAKAELNTLFF